MVQMIDSGLQHTDFHSKIAALYVVAMKNNAAIFNSYSFGKSCVFMKWKIASQKEQWHQVDVF